MWLCSAYYLLDSEKLRKMRDVKLIETKRNEGQKTVSLLILISDISAMYLQAVKLTFNPLN
ncbi:hypothetical protein MtrunA17_Chr8g0359601 [Medicago truncatula]|uniref:Uncharacterized protein n=1 Tax=Medicago truncatula TaxID=3880 RepID=A0A396GQA1_MEDTR|nr:hypothetical protein MtrunA17_Chr8g0359601 [Medicago truncatula]